MANIKKIIFVSLYFFFSISSYGQSQRHEERILVNYTYLGAFSKEMAQIALTKMPPLEVLEARHEVTLYKINYKTPAPDGHITTASGLVAVPLVDDALGIVSYQHGTRFNHEDAPSRIKEGDAVYPALFSSHGGYLTVMPDYLGFGDNELPLHPYVQYETLASSSVNMLLAAKELTQILKIDLNGQLYIGGYSEGGFSSLVLFELLATQYPDIPVTAVALGSAPYDWNETMQFIMRDPGPRATAYLAYFFYSLQSYKNYWTDLSQLFVSPYNVTIPELFDGKHSTKEILNALPPNPALIFQPEFFDAILNHTEANSELLKNYFNHYSFSPTAPLLLVGTKGDRDVPYHGAEIAYEQFRSAGSTVFIQSVSDSLDHRDAGPYVFYEMLQFFKRFQGSNRYSK